MRVNEFALVTNGNMASNVSGIQALNQAFGYSVQAVWTGSPVGTMKLQASLDGTNWDDIANSSQSVNGAGSFLWNVSEVQYPYVQLVYTASSGSGTLNANVFYRGF